MVTEPSPFSVPVLLFPIQGPLLLSAHRATFLYPYSSPLPLTKHPVLVPGLSLDSPGEEGVVPEQVKEGPREQETRPGAVLPGRGRMLATALAVLPAAQGRGWSE